MVGLPGETEQDMMDTIALNRRTGADFAEVSIFQPFPGTQMHDHCCANGHLDRDAQKIESYNTTTILKGSKETKNKIFVLHKMFTTLVDHPRLKPLLRILYRFRFLNGLLNLYYRLYYGRNMHRKIYAGQIPLPLRLRAALNLILSKSRA